MSRLPVIFGYAGALPFVLFLLLTLLISDPEHAQLLTFIQTAYSAMILSFLAGIHWGQAIPRNHHKQMAFAMLPTIVCLFLMIWTFVVDPVLPLVILASMFWVMFEADKRFMPIEFIPQGYFKFRMRLTIIVSTTLVLSALSIVSLF